MMLRTLLSGRNKDSCGAKLCECHRGVLEIQAETNIEAWSFGMLGYWKMASVQGTRVWLFGPKREQEINGAQNQRLAFTFLA